jgi:hypothetical protein
VRVTAKRIPKRYVDVDVDSLAADMVMVEGRKGKFKFQSCAERFTGKYPYGMMPYATITNRPN